MTYGATRIQRDALDSCLSFGGDAERCAELCKEIDDALEEVMEERDKLRDKVERLTEELESTIAKLSGRGEDGK